MLFVLACKAFRLCRRLLGIFAGLFSLFLVLNLLIPLPRFKLEEDYSTVYMDRRGEILRVSLSPSEKYRIKLPLDEMSTYMKRGIVAYEDQYFRYHRGANPISIVRALGQNLYSGRVISGASTITMQIARMMERRPRTVRSKIIETFRAFQLEFAYTKDELLEIYLNSIPMGGNLEGVGAGAYYYFGKSARDLSFHEAALLIGLPNSPTRNRPDRFPEQAQDQMKKVIAHTGPRMDSPEDRLPLTDCSPYSGKVFPFPFKVPHLIESGRKGKNRFFVQYTIDLAVQAHCENLLRITFDKYRGEGIFNGAIVVVDNRTREVIAYIGSPEYLDREHCGQINGAAIPRSPGSALKPFLYGRAVEQGLITPEKILYDIPITDDEYSPANYSKSCLGLVTARYALIHSLNIPAVRLERDMGDQGLKGLLKRVSLQKDDIRIDDSGLSVVLGGYPLTLERMTTLYMALARGGEFRPLKYCIDATDENIAPIRLLKKEACFIIAEMLSDCHRPDLPYNWEFTPYRSRVALKTGTSFGLKDAWCFGYNPDYTVGVWLGNADNRGSPHLVGIQKAAPVMIEIFNYVSHGADSWFRRPPDVKVRKVCAVSGEKQDRFCLHGYKEDFFISGVSSEQTCPIHRRIHIRRADSMEVCSYCMKGDRSLYETRIIEYWPKEVITFLRKEGHTYMPLPQHNPSCSHFYSKDRPRIISPMVGSQYELDENLPDDIQKIPLKAFIAQDSDRVFWFLNSKLVHEGEPHETYFLTPERGTWKISAVDSRGRSDTVTIEVY